MSHLKNLNFRYNFNQSLEHELDNVTELQKLDFGNRFNQPLNNRITTSFIKIQNLQTIDIDIPEGYQKPIIVPSSDYQKMCKDM